MKLKTVQIDGKTYAEVLDDKPVYVHDDGKEIGFDAANASGTISRLNREAQGHRETKEALEKQVKAFEGIADPEAARKALQTVANLDAKKLIDAGEVENVKAEISKAFQAQLDEAKANSQALESQLYAEKIGGSFARSKLIAEKIAVPPDMIQATFGSSFKIEEGKVVAYDANGQKIFSRVKPGELADFDEALESLIEAYPHKDHILKAKGGNGGGAGGSAGAQPPQGNFGGSPTERKSAIASKFDMTAL